MINYLFILRKKHINYIYKWSAEDLWRFMSIKPDKLELQSYDFCRSIKWHVALSNPHSCIADNNRSNTVLAKRIPVPLDQSVKIRIRIQIPVLAPSLCLKKSVGNGLAAILATKRSTSITLRTIMKHESDGIHSGFEILWKCHQNSSSDISGPVPEKGLMSSKYF